MFKYSSININIRGRAAGQIQYSHLIKKGRQKYPGSLPNLRFNPYLLERYKIEFIEQVVPHECAHLVAYELYGMNIKPHGLEWKKIMVSLYNQTPHVTHRFEIAKTTRRLFNYNCECIDVNHELTVIRHNKILKQKAVYLCKKCKSPLTFKI